MARRMKGQRPCLIMPRQSESRAPGQADYARELAGAKRLVLWSAGAFNTAGRLSASVSIALRSRRNAMPAAVRCAKTLHCSPVSRSVPHQTQEPCDADQTTAPLGMTIEQLRELDHSLRV